MGLVFVLWSVIKCFDISFTFIFYLVCMRKIVLFFCLASAICDVNAQKEDSIFIRNIANEVLTHSTAYENLRMLTKQIGARLTGSPQMVKAEKWGAKALELAGADKVWLQQCQVPRWVRGGKDMATATYVSSSAAKKQKPLAVTALGNSVGTMKPLTLPVIEVKNFDDLAKKKEQVKGKIVFYNYAFNPKFIQTFDAYGDAAAYRVDGPSEAARHGAKAAIVRSMTHTPGNDPHTGTLVYKDSLPKIPAVAIGLEDADWLSSELLNGEVSVSLHTHGKFLPDTIGHNVIGEITGTEFPEEYIVVSGHLDSWDLAEGAHDDGAGCVQAIEVLRAFKALGYKPKRTLRVVLFANEENGSRGSDKYLQEAKSKNEKHIFALESDNGGFTPRGFKLKASQAQKQRIAGWMPLLHAYGSYEIGEGAGADVQGLYDSLGVAASEFLPDTQRYFDVHHTKADVFEAVNKRELELGAINMAAMIYLIDKYGLPLSP